MSPEEHEALKTAIRMLADGIAAAAQHAGYSGAKKLPAAIAEVLKTPVPAPVPSVAFGTVTLNADVATDDERRRFAEHPEEQAEIADRVNRRALSAR